MNFDLNRTANTTRNDQADIFTGDVYRKFCASRGRVLAKLLYTPRNPGGDMTIHLIRHTTTCVRMLRARECGD